MKTHLCVDVRGALRQRAYENGGFVHPDGRPMSNDEAFDALCDELAKGRRVIRLGKCDNFDYQNGCQGHPDDWQPPSATGDK